MKASECYYEVLGPWAEVDAVPMRRVSPRLTSLENKTIGLFDSSKIASRGVLTAVEERLREKLHATQFSWFTAGSYYHGQPHFREQKHKEWRERFEEWIKGVDAVILAQGD